MSAPQLQAKLSLGSYKAAFDRLAGIGIAMTPATYADIHAMAA